jgi:hypothetical protein
LDVATIWKDDPNGIGMKISIAPILEKGLTLCK